MSQEREQLKKIIPLFVIGGYLFYITELGLAQEENEQSVDDRSDMTILGERWPLLAPPVVNDAASEMVALCSSMAGPYVNEGFQTALAAVPMFNPVTGEENNFFPISVTCGNVREVNSQKLINEVPSIVIQLVKIQEEGENTWLQDVVRSGETYNVMSPFFEMDFLHGYDVEALADGDVIKIPFHQEATVQTYPYNMQEIHLRLFEILKSQGITPFLSTPHEQLNHLQIDVSRIAGYSGTTLHLFITRSLGGQERSFDGRTYNRLTEGMPEVPNIVEKEGNWYLEMPDGDVQLEGNGLSTYVIFENNSVLEGDDNYTGWLIFVFFCLLVAAAWLKRREIKGFFLPNGPKPEKRKELSEAEKIDVTKRTSQLQQALKNPIYNAEFALTIFKEVTYLNESLKGQRLEKVLHKPDQEVIEFAKKLQKFTWGTVVRISNDNILYDFCRTLVNTHAPLYPKSSDIAGFNQEVVVFNKQLEVYKQLLKKLTEPEDRTVQAVQNQDYFPAVEQFFSALIPLSKKVEVTEDTYTLSVNNKVLKGTSKELIELLSQEFPGNKESIKRLLKSEDFFSFLLYLNTRSKLPFNEAFKTITYATSNVETVYTDESKTQVKEEIKSITWKIGGVTWKISKSSIQSVTELEIVS